MAWSWLCSPGGPLSAGVGGVTASCDKAAYTGVQWVTAGLPYGFARGTSLGWGEEEKGSPLLPDADLT